MEVTVQKLACGTVNITRGDETRCLAEWARMLGIPKSTLAFRIRRGVRGERLLARGKIGRNVAITSHGKTQNMSAWARELGISLSVFSRRVSAMGADAAISSGGRSLFPGDLARSKDLSWWPELDHPWEDDPRAKYVVAHHPDGITLDEIGLLLGVTRERVRQIVESALRKLKNQPGSREVVAFLLEQSKERESRAKQVVYPECLGFGEAATISAMALHGKSKKSAA